MLHKLTFQSLLNKGMKRFGELPAITLLPTGETITYDELWKKTELISSYLLRLGAGRGVRIATIIPNSLESVMFGLAIQQCGATLVPLSEKLGKREIQFILKEAKPEVVIIATKTHFDTFFEYLEEMKKEDVHVIGLPTFNINYPEEFERFQWPSEINNLDLPLAEAEDIALLSYTGGTTGTPKGVMHSQKGLGAAILSAAIEDPLDDRDRVLLSTPIVHSAGSLLWRSLVSGVHVYVMGSFDAAEFIRAIKEHEITTTFMVPTMLYRLLDQTKKMEYDMSSMRNIFYGASPISQSALKKLLKYSGPLCASNTA